MIYLIDNVDLHATNEFRCFIRNEQMEGLLIDFVSNVERKKIELESWEANIAKEEDEEEVLGQQRAEVEKKED